MADGPDWKSSVDARITRHVDSYRWKSDWKRSNTCVLMMLIYQLSIKRREEADDGRYLSRMSVAAWSEASSKWWRHGDLLFSLSDRLWSKLNMTPPGGYQRNQCRINYWQHVPFSNWFGRFDDGQVDLKRSNGGGWAVYDDAICGWFLAETFLGGMVETRKSVATCRGLPATRYGCNWFPFAAIASVGRNLKTLPRQWRHIKKEVG